ncbi:unknown [Bacteroides sp. CAG:598]|nr:unknown [Bacteroides sp. CAG:598]
MDYVVFLWLNIYFSVVKWHFRSLKRHFTMLIIKVQMTDLD